MERTDILFKLMYDDEKQHMLRFDQAQMKKKVWTVGLENDSNELLRKMTYKCFKYGYR